jgi:hypothetical protein
VDEDQKGKAGNGSLGMPSFSCLKSIPSSALQVQYCSQFQRSVVSRQAVIIIIYCIASSYVSGGGGIIALYTLRGCEFARRSNNPLDQTEAG